MAFVLLINPWITDFAAYDLWAKPLGLLFIASLLKEGGIDVVFIDCLDRFYTEKERKGFIPGKNRFYGTGKYPKEPIEKPKVFENHPRTYYRYGISMEAFTKALESLPERPDLVMITSIMTYWYPGAFEAIRKVKEVFPEVPIWLGGIYAKLCKEHALKFSGASRVIDEPLSAIPELIERELHIKLSNKSRWEYFSSFPRPFWEAYHRKTYGVLLTSLGCSFGCSYCASSLLQPKVQKRSWKTIYDEIIYHYEQGIIDFAFYDDALLITGWEPLKAVLDQVIKDNLKVRFHTPNALHVSAIDEEKSELLFHGGFKTIRLGFETAFLKYHVKWGGKRIEREQFSRVVKILHKTGWDINDLGVYLLSGVPGQKPEDVKASIDFVASEGALPFIAEYSPIPGTKLWEESLKVSNFALEKEPLFHNNSFFACRRDDFTYEDMVELKDYARRVRSLLTSMSMADSS